MRRRSSSYTQMDGERDREREKRRLAWMLQQEMEREHERLKRKKIEEYERKRAEELERNRKRRLQRSRSLSRSRSRSEESHYKSRLKSISNNKSQNAPEKLSTSVRNRPLFKGPEGSSKMDPSKLQEIVVNIHRKISAPATETCEIRRDILNPEEITLKRRDGEGAKPIFDRDELKQSEVQPVEVEEYRTIEAVGKSNSVKKLNIKRRSVSSSPRRHRSTSPRAHSTSRSHSHRSRREEYSKHHTNDYHHKDYKSDRHYSDTRERSREDLRRPKTSRGRSFSRERDYHRSERDYSRTSRSEKEYRDYRERSKDRSYDRRERRNSSREESSHPQYVQQVPYPVYYGDFAPRPMIVGPPIPPPIRGPMGRGRLPMTPIRPPYPPRFIAPPNMYRTVLPSDPRYGRMY